MSPRALLTLASLAVAVSLERGAFYGVRSVLLVHLSSDGTPVAEVARLLGMTAWLTYGGALVGGALALALGPRWTAVIGAAIAAGGVTLLGLGASPGLSLLAFAAGAGIFRPCPWAAAAETVFAEDDARAIAGAGRMAYATRFAIVAACVTLLYGCVNVSALLAVPIAGSLYTGIGFSSVAWIGAGIELCAAGAAAAGAVIGPRRFLAPAAPVVEGPYRDPAMRPGALTPPPDAPRALAGLGIVGAITALYVLTMSASYLRGSRLEQPLVSAVNPVVVLVVSAIMFFVWVGFSVSKRAPAPLWPWGVGLVVFGAGAIATGLAVDDELGVAPVRHLVGIVLMAAGEATVGPIGMMYASTATRGRVATLVVAAFGLTSWVGMFGTFALGSRPLLFALGVVLTALGAVAAARAKSLHERFFV